MPIELGCAYTDVITGYQGVATGHCTYISGCNQTLLIPRVTPEGKRDSGEWFDDQRLKREWALPPIVLDNGNTPGCDRAAPKR